MLPLFVTNHVDALVLGAMYVVWITLEMIWSRSRRPGRNAEVHDRASGTAIMLGIWVGIMAGYVLAFDEPRFAIRPERALLFYAGLGLMAGGIALRWYAIHVLGRYFTTLVAVQPGQKVVSNGPYHFVRHPSYSGALLTILGLALALTNWLSLAVMMGLAFIGYSYRIAVEERTLVKSLGEPYRQYMNKTKRIIPFVI